MSMTVSAPRLVRCQAAAASRAGGARRLSAVAPRATGSREEELRKMAEFKSGLSAKLEAQSRPGAVSTAATPAGSAETAAPPAAGKQLREVGQADYYDAIREAGDQLVLVDCFTEWCGPCKMILPTLQQWAEELEGKVTILKFNCNKANKELGVSLGIKVAPTFILYKNNEKVDMMTGAKTDQLRALIEKHM